MTLRDWATVGLIGGLFAYVVAAYLVGAAGGFR
jgi:hypothetical protein